jgi:ferritin-like metal-binding protein YciE
MKASEQKVAQYLVEARASEDALVRVLQSQVAMTPTGSYRSALDKHLDETRRHSARIADRLKEIKAGSNPILSVVGFWEEVAGQALAFGKTPLDLLRGTGGEEKVLKNAKDAAATEALEIATYTALERVARSVGDEKTAKLAAEILAEEERMLTRILREIPKLADAVVGADVRGHGSYDVSTTGAGQVVRAAGAEAKSTVRETEATAKRTIRGAQADAKTAARKTTATTKRNARNARKVPGVAQAEGQIKGAIAGETDLAIANYDSLTAEEIISRLPSLSQIDLAKIDSYERKNQDRATVLSRVTALRGDEPWPGYDELTVAEVQAVLAEGDDERVKQARSYERSHKNRAGVMNAAERDLSNA